MMGGKTVGAHISTTTHVGSKFYEESERDKKNAVFIGISVAQYKQTLYSIQVDETSPMGYKSEIIL